MVAGLALREDGLAAPVFHDGLGDSCRIEKCLCVELAERHHRLRRLWLRQLHVDTVTALVLHAMDRATSPGMGVCTTAHPRKVPSTPRPAGSDSAMSSIPEKNAHVSDRSSDQ